MSSQMYSRYVPPKKKQKLSAAPIELPSRPIESSPSVNLSLNESKSKPHCISDSTSTFRKTRPDKTTDSKPKKAKKKSKEDHEAEAEGEDGGTQEELKRHKTLMEKREKSLRKAQKLAKRNAKDAITTEETIDEPAE